MNQSDRIKQPFVASSSCRCGVLGVRLAPRLRRASVCFILTLWSLNIYFEPEARADDLKNEDVLFGGVKPSASEGQSSGEPPASAVVTESAVDDPLQIGGLFFQRVVVSAQEGISFADAPIAAPLQFDFYLDGRPSERLRAFVKPRLLFDGTRDEYSNASSGSTLDSLSVIASSATIETTNPQTVLDQAWLKFDMNHIVFATIGKQQVKWGVSRFWNPTDFLSSQRRDPLATNDLRLGATMAKLEIPVEKMGTNFYVLGLFDNPEPASTLGQMGGALRVESVLGETEIGAETVLRGEGDPNFGIDLSSALGPFDVYAEGSLLISAPNPLYQLIAAPTAGADVSTLISENTPEGPFVQVSGGINYSFAWRENRLATLGAEAFYNELGYSQSAIYPLLIFLGEFQPFYLGKKYAGLFLSAEGPDAQKKTTTLLSTLGNLSDETFISRIDFSWKVLTYLSFEAFADMHYGASGGEFNFLLNTPELTYQGNTVAAIDLPRTLFDVGIGLKMGL